MLYLYSIVAGIIQAITEFVPVSSSGHLVILHDILNFQVGQNLVFDVALHLGTALALIIYFRSYIKKYLVALFLVFVPKKKVNQVDLKDLLLIIYATIPAAIIGVLLDRFAPEIFRQTWIVVVTLIVGAVLFFIVEKYAKHTRDFTGMGIGRALFVGVAQILALIPGFSRSGLTIIAGMSVKLTRTEAAKFSFLLSIPIVLGAGIYKLLDLKWALLPTTEIWAFVIGFVVAAVIGFFVIKYFLRFLERYTLKGFAWYRIVIAVVLLIWIFV